MPKQPLVLIAAKYADGDRAKTIVDMLGEMDKAGTIDLSDAATVTKGADGKLQITETRELTTKQGAKRGAIAAGVVGVLFPPALVASAVAGGAAGAAWGKLRDTGLKSKQIEEMGEKLEAGQAAVVALVSEQSVQALEKAMQGYDGELLTHTFSASESETIEQAASTTS
jgi:uncharacterized membrane protein